MAIPKNSWAILPATQALFGKLKCTLEQAMLEYGDGTMLICLRKNPASHDTVMFLHSSGTMPQELVGTQHAAHHDQNFRSYGDLSVFAAIPYTVVNRRVLCTLPDVWIKKDRLSLDTKAALFCFK